MKTVMVLALAGLLGACAAQPERLQATRWPQVTVNAPEAFVRSKMLLAVVNGTGTLVDSSDNLIKFEAPMEGGEATTNQVLLGCGFCETPKRVGLVTVVDTGEGTLVSMQYWKEIQNKPGVWQRYETDTNAEYNSTVTFLQQFKDKVEAKYLAQP